MIKIDINVPSKAGLVRAAMADIETQITKKARDAVARHGGVTVRFRRNPDGRAPGRSSSRARKQPSRRPSQSDTQ